MTTAARTIHRTLTTAAHALVDPQPSLEARMKLAQGLLTLAAMIEDVAAGKIGALQLLEAEGIIPGTEPHGRFRRQVTRHAGLNATYATIVEFDMNHGAQAARSAVALEEPAQAAARSSSPQGDSAQKPAAAPTETIPTTPTHD
jgi:hypothetical protein